MRPLFSGGSVERMLGVARGLALLGRNVKVQLTLGFRVSRWLVVRCTAVRLDGGVGMLGALVCGMIRPRMMPGAFAHGLVGLRLKSRDASMSRARLNRRVEGGFDLRCMDGVPSPAFVFGVGIGDHRRRAVILTANDGGRPVMLAGRQGKAVGD
eukprot:3935446-Rhodomonas_salina.1